MSGMAVFEWRTSRICSKSVRELSENRSSLAEFLGVISYAPVQVCKVRIEVVIHFKFSWCLVKEHPRHARTPQRICQEWQSLVTTASCKGFPAHRPSKLFIVSFGPCKRAPCLSFCKTTSKLYYFLLIWKEAHREYAHDAADKQTNEEGQHSVIPSCCDMGGLHGIIGKAMHISVVIIPGITAMNTPSTNVGFCF